MRRMMFMAALLAAAGDEGSALAAGADIGDPPPEAAPVGEGIAEVPQSATSAPAEVEPVPGAGAAPANDEPDQDVDPDADTQVKPIPEGTAEVRRDNVVLRNHMIHVIELECGAAIAGIATHSYQLIPPATEPTGEQRKEWKQAARSCADANLQLFRDRINTPS